jgi:hypothetical protein
MGHMAGDVSVITEREQRYRKFWKRRISGRYRSSASKPPRVDVYAFLPTWNPWAPARSYFVYLTGGLSDAALADAPAGTRFPRIELSCYARHVKGFGNPQDEVAKWLHAFARLPFEENLRISPGDTFDVGQPLAPGSDMSAFYFELTPLVDKDELCRATIHAEAVIHVIPISEAERSLAASKGFQALADAFRHARVPPVFDLERRSCV